MKLFRNTPPPLILKNVVFRSERGIIKCLLICTVNMDLHHDPNIIAPWFLTFEIRLAANPLQHELVMQYDSGILNRFCLKFKIRIGKKHYFDLSAMEMVF